MVRIPDRPDAHIARGVPGAGGFGLAGGGAAEITAAVSQGAAHLFRAALHIQETRDHDLLVEAQNRHTAGIGDFTRAAENERVADKARGFTREYGEFSDRTRDETLAWMDGAGGSRRAASAFRHWAEGRKNAGLEGAARFEHGQLLAHGKDMFEARVAAVREQAERDPESFADAAKQLEESFVLAAGQGIFRPQEAKNRLAEARDALGRAAFESLYAKAPGRAARRMDLFGLSPAEQARMKKRFAADAAHAKAMAAAKKAGDLGALGEKLADAEALLAAGNPAPMRALAGEYLALGEEKKAAALIKEAEKGERLKGAFDLAAALPLPELGAEMEKIRTGLETWSPGPAVDPPEGERPAVLAEKLGVFGEVFQRRKEALLKDGAAATAAEAEEIAAGRKDRNAPRGEAASGARLYLQRRDGLPERERRVLTGAEAHALRENWKAAPPGELPLLAREITAEYGRYAQRVFAEMKLSPLVVDAVMRAQGADGAPRLEAISGAALLAAADNADPNALPRLEDLPARRAELLEGGENESVRLKWSAAMTGLMPSNAGFAAQRKAELALVDKILAVNNGDTAGARDALDNGRTLLEGARHICMYDKREIDGEDLQRGLEYVAVTELGAFAERGASEDPEERAARAADLVRTGVWADAPEGEGWVLFDPRMQAPVVDAAGRYFRVTPKRAREAAAARRAAYGAGSGGAAGGGGVIFP